MSKGTSRNAVKRAKRAQEKAAQREAASAEPFIGPIRAPKPRNMTAAEMDAAIQRALMGTTFGRIASVILSS